MLVRCFIRTSFFRLGNDLRQRNHTNGQRVFTNTRSVVETFAPKESENQTPNVLTHHSTNNRALEQVKILHKYRVMRDKLTPLLDYLQSAGERERG